MIKKLGLIVLIILIGLIAVGIVERKAILGFPGKILPYNGRIVKPVALYWIGSGYGSRINPLTLKKEFHSAVDFASLQGMAVRAAMDGKIKRIESNDPSLGNFVEIEDTDGTFTLYGHMSQFGDIGIGRGVGAGSVIGAVGSTGKSTGPHLHFGYTDKNHVPKDPCELLRIWNPMCKSNMI